MILFLKLLSFCLDYCLNMYVVHIYYFSEDADRIKDDILISSILNPSFAKVFTIWLILTSLFKTKYHTFLIITNISISIQICAEIGKNIIGGANLRHPKLTSH